MAVNYKKELENAAKSMILIHEPDTLVKIIVHRIVQKVGVSHAAILLGDRAENFYKLTTSRLPAGLKIPKSLSRIHKDSQFIRFFKNSENKVIFKSGIFSCDKARELLELYPSGPLHKSILAVLRQLEIFKAVVCIPSYYRDNLLGILLLGGKKNNKGISRHELDFFVAITLDVAMAIRNAQLFRELEYELKEKQKLFINTSLALAAAIDAKDPHTHGHTARVTNLSLEIARLLIAKNKKRFDEKFLEQLHIAALLHDIGKIGIPESILNKKGPLSSREAEMVRNHPTIGANILGPIAELDQAILGVKYHHEKHDGSGYPEGLKGDRIPFIASIISVADTFDAMTTDRPYRRSIPKEEALDEIKRVSNSQLNPQVVSTLVELYDSGNL